MFGKGKDRKITMDERLKREKEIKEIRKAQKTFFMGLIGLGLRDLS